jgi:hypothetical protein
MDIIDIAQECLGKRFVVLKSPNDKPPLYGGVFPEARPLGKTADGGSKWQYRADRLLEAIRRTPIPQKNVRLNPLQ